MPELYVVIRLRNFCKTSFYLLFDKSIEISITIEFPLKQLKYLTSTDNSEFCNKVKWYSISLMGLMNLKKNYQKFEYLLLLKI